MTETRQLLDALRAAHVDFIVVGGVAMVVRGSGRTTVDIDIVYSRSPDNLRRLADALRPFRPRLRGAPADLPFLWDDLTLRSGLNFTLTTDAGDIDLLGEMTGVGGYPEALVLATDVDLFGGKTRVLTLDGLARAKRAAGRAKDLLDLAEIEEIRKRRKD